MSLVAVKKTLGSNRGKSSAQPVRLDGLQILAESELFDSKSRNLTCELLSITAWNLPASREFGESKQKRQLRRKSFFKVNNKTDFKRFLTKQNLQIIA